MNIGPVLKYSDQLLESLITRNLCQNYEYSSTRCSTLESLEQQKLLKCYLESRSFSLNGISNEEEISCQFCSASSELAY